MQMTKETEKTTGWPFVIKAGNNLCNEVYRYLIAILLLVLMMPIQAQQYRSEVRLSALKAFNGKSMQFVSKSVVKNGYALSAEANTDCKVYGIRVYSETTPMCSDLISFDASNPAVITKEKSLGFKSVRAAAGYEGTYYIIDSDDGLTPNRFIKLDLDTKEMETVLTYKLYVNPETSLILSDMTYDPSTNQLYALAFDILGSDPDAEEIDVPLGLYAVDPKTGTFKLIGTQNILNFVALAASPEGSLYGLADDGSLWEIDKVTGKPLLDLSYAILDLPAAGLQSMSFNMDTNVLYWSGFFINGETGTAKFSSFVFGEDEVVWNEIGQPEGNAEILGLYIDPNPLPKTSPAVVENLKAVPGVNGERKITLTWTNPKTDLQGNKLAGDLSVAVYRNGTLATTLAKKAVGETVTWNDTDVEGMVAYKVAAINTSGEGKAVYSDSVFVGIDVPGAVQKLNCTKADDNYDLTIAWEVPVKGKHNGWFDENTLSYTVVRHPDGLELVKGLTECSYTDRTINETHGYYYEVIPVTSAGAGEPAFSNTSVSGPALVIPYHCDFNTDDQYRLWTIWDGDQDNQTWYLDSYNDARGAYMKYFPDLELNPDKKTDDWLVSAPIQFSAGKNYVLSYSLQTLGGELFPLDYSITYGKGSRPEQQVNIIADYQKERNEDSFDYVRHSVPFRVTADGDYNIAFHAYNAVKAQIANIVIEELPTTDMSIVSLKGFVVPSVGTTSEYEVIVKNVGYEQVSAYTLKLVDEAGSVLATLQVKEPIASQEEKACVLSWVPEHVGAVKLKAEVDGVDSDANAANNQSTTLAVNVLEAGVWKHLTDGTVATPMVPFYLYQSNSTIQTIYTKEKIASAKCQVEGLVLYYTPTAKEKPYEFVTRVKLANVEESGFDKANPAPIAADRLTSVFEGSVVIEPSLGMIALLFDEPFDYEGGNLCVVLEQQNTASNSWIKWLCDYKSGDPVYHSLTYSGSVPFDYTQKMHAGKDVANLSFFLTGQDTSIHNPFVEGQQSAVYFDNVHKALLFNTPCRTINVYTLTGVLLESASEISSVFSLSHLSNGTYLVELIGEDKTRTVKKIVL